MTLVKECLSKEETKTCTREAEVEKAPNTLTWTEKYRPRKLTDLVDQTEVVNMLKSLLKSHKVTIVDENVET